MMEWKRIVYDNVYVLEYIEYEVSLVCTFGMKRDEGD